MVLVQDAGDRREKKTALKKKTPPCFHRMGFCTLGPAASYSPTHSRVQYHGLWRA